MHSSERKQENVKQQEFISNVKWNFDPVSFLIKILGKIDTDDKNNFIFNFIILIF